MAKKIYTGMNRDELLLELENLKQEYGDLEDDQDMVLSQNGQHVNTESVKARFKLMFDDLVGDYESEVIDIIVTWNYKLCTSHEYINRGQQ